MPHRDTIGVTGDRNYSSDRIKQLKAYYLRNWEDETYLVPEEHAKAFDKLIEKIDNLNEGKTKDKAYDKFNTEYQEYKQEGDLYSTKLYIR